MSQLQRLCCSLAGRLRLSSHRQAALQTAARHLATRAGDDGEGSSSDEEASVHDSLGEEAVQLGQQEDSDDETSFGTAAAGPLPDGRPAYAKPTREADEAFFMSDGLRALWEEVQRNGEQAVLDQIEKEEAVGGEAAGAAGPQPAAASGDGSAAAAHAEDSDLEEEEEGAALAAAGPAEAGKVAAAGEGDDEVGPDDWRLLLEAIRLYFTAAPVEDEELDGLNELDREILAAIAGVLSEEFEGKPDVEVFNLAPPGQLPWEILEVDDEAGAVHWGVDFTEGQAQDPWRNALLSNDAKELMYEMHKDDPEGHSVEVLAQMFRVRRQRVMAILALKQIEEKARAAGQIKPEMDEVAEMMEQDVYECYEAMGSGERHYTVLPSYPNFQELKPGEVVSRLEAKLGKPLDQVTDADLTPELAREVLGVRTKDELEEEIAFKEEEQLVDDFRRNLAFNMGEIGKGISRRSRKGSAPKRPAGGWGLVVTPLDKSSNPQQQAKQSFVALPDGKQRPLTEDELLYLQRAAAIPRRKVL